MKRSERLRRDILHYCGLSVAFFLWAVIAGCGAVVTDEDGGEFLHTAAICAVIALMIFAIRNLLEAIRHARLLALWNQSYPAGTGKSDATRDAG